MAGPFTPTDKLVARVLVAIGALVGAAVGVVITEIAFAFACDVPEGCEGLSDPIKMRVLAWVMAASVLVSIVLALLKQRTATIAAVLVTTVFFVIWLSLFVYIIDGDL